MFDSMNVDLNCMNCCLFLVVLYCLCALIVNTMLRHVTIYDSEVFSTSVMILRSFSVSVVMPWCLRASVGMPQSFPKSLYKAVRKWFRLVM